MFLHYPQYIDGLIADFDLLIIGGFWTASKGSLSKFVLAIRDADSADDAGVFLACTHITSGLSQQEYAALNAKLRPHWTAVANKRDASDISTPLGCQIRFGAQMPDVWIEPSHSVVLQVKAAELVQSGAFASGYTMRFPRVQAVREDKPWRDCCTRREFEALCMVSFYF